MTETVNASEPARTPERPIQTNWVVISGAPSSGKSTTFEHLSNILQRQGFRLEPEVERRIIEEDDKKGIKRENTPEYAMALEHRFLKAREELEKSLDPSSPVIMDRSLLEIIAYARYYRADETFALGAAKRYRYRQVYYLEPLKNYEQDTTRVEDVEFAKWMHENLPKLYEEFGYEIIRVPAMPVSEEEVPDKTERIARSVENRAEFILSSLELQATNLS